MKALLYDELVPWYRPLDPPEGHREEAATYREAFERATSGSTLLDLGAGAGNNAYHLKKRFKCTLTDISEPMLGLSRELNLSQICMAPPSVRGRLPRRGDAASHRGRRD